MSDVLLSVLLISQLPAKLKRRTGEQERGLAKRSGLVMRQITSRQTSWFSRFFMPKETADELY